MSTIGRMPNHTYMQMHSDGLEIVGVLSYRCIEHETDLRISGGDDTIMGGSAFSPHFLQSGSFGPRLLPWNDC